MASLTTTLRNQRLALIKTANDVGGVNTGKLVIYNGPVPANADATPSGQTVLATLTNVSITTPSNGSSTVTATAQNASNTGVPSYARLTDLNGNTYMQVTAGVGSGDLSLNQNIALGGQVSLTSGTLPEGNA